MSALQTIATPQQTNVSPPASQPPLKDPMMTAVIANPTQNVALGIARHPLKPASPHVLPLTQVGLPIRIHVFVHLIPNAGQVTAKYPLIHASLHV